MSAPPSQTVTDVVKRLKAVVGPADGMIPLHVPEFDGTERAYVTECIDTGWVSSVGSFVDRFERDVARACGADFGVAVVNGTAAIEIALRVAGVKAGDEVLIPALTFVATANAVHHIGAIPHLVDSCYETMGIDAEVLASYLRGIGQSTGAGLINRHSGRKIAAIVPMHVFGHPVDMVALNAVADTFGLVVIEDAAEGLGSLSNGRPLGSFGKLAALSFNGNKIITTGGGGMIVTNDAALARRAKHLTTTAKVPHAWEFMHDEVGYNFRLPNLNAALGVAQLEQLAVRVEKKRGLALKYINAFADCAAGQMFVEPKGAASNYWLNVLLLAPGTSMDARDTLLQGLNDAGYMSRPVWKLMHRLSFNADCPRAPLPVAEDLESRVINLPSSAHLFDRT